MSHQMTYNEDCIAHFAFRYSLGRKTAASSIVVKHLTDNWDRLFPATRPGIQREIREAIDDGSAGDPCDVKEWQKILELKP